MLKDESWPLVEGPVQNLLDKLRKKGIPLTEYVSDSIYLGILTGLDKAFIIDHETRNYLVNKDPRSSDLIKPFLKGKDVKRYQPIIPGYAHVASNERNPKSLFRSSLPPGRWRCSDAAVRCRT